MDCIMKKIKRAYSHAAKEFSKLKPDDEIIKRGSLDYPPLLEKTKQAPRFLYLRGRKGLLQESSFGLGGCLLVLNKEHMSLLEG